MKKFACLMICLFGGFVSSGYSQSIIDYFYPSTGTVSSRIPDLPDGERLNTFSIDNGNYYFEDKIIVYSNLGVYEFYYSQDNIIITKDRIISKSGKRRTLEGAYGYYKNNTILMLPQPNKSVSWGFKMPLGYESIRTAKLVTLNMPVVGGMKNINAIEVSANGKPIEYWAKGYGLIINWGYIRRGFSKNYTVSKYYDDEKKNRKEQEAKERKEREEQEAEKRKEQSERIRKERKQFIKDSLLLKRINDGEVFSEYECIYKPQITMDLSKLSNRWRIVDNPKMKGRTYSRITNQSYMVDVLTDGTITNLKITGTSSEPLADLLTGLTYISPGKMLVRNKKYDINSWMRFYYDECVCDDKENIYDVVLNLKKSKKGLSFNVKKIKYAISSEDMTYIENYLKNEKNIKSLPNGKYSILIKTTWVARINLEKINSKLKSSCVEKRFYSIHCKTERGTINLNIN